MGSALCQGLAVFVAVHHHTKAHAGFEQNGLYELLIAGVSPGDKTLFSPKLCDYIKILGFYFFHRH